MLKFQRLTHALFSPMEKARDFVPSYQGDTLTSLLLILALRQSFVNPLQKHFKHPFSCWACKSNVPFRHLSQSSPFVFALKIRENMFVVTC